MKSLGEYITESQHWINNPVAGDDFAINIREDYLLETYVIEASAHYVLLEADDTAVNVLTEYGMLDELGEGVMRDIDMDLRHIARTERIDALVDGLRGEFGPSTARYLHDLLDEVDQDLERQGMTTIGMEMRLEMLMDRVRELVPDLEPMDEAKYRGREVPLGKPMAGDVKKKKVYVRKPNGNVVKVEFGDPNMRIRKSNPKRRKSFRARHNCANPGPRWKARYWSCRAW